MIYHPLLDAPGPTQVYSALDFKLAWTVTIHKSQGLTLNKVVIYIGKKEFSCGLRFVARSRVRHIADLHFPATVKSFKQCLRERQLEDQKAFVDATSQCIFTPVWPFSHCWGYSLSTIIDEDVPCASTEDIPSPPASSFLTCVRTLLRRGHTTSTNIWFSFSRWGHTFSCNTSDSTTGEEHQPSPWQIIIILSRSSPQLTTSTTRVYTIKCLPNSLPLYIDPLDLSVPSTVFSPIFGQREVNCSTTSVPHQR